jgi:hypothetical protein
MVENSEGRLPLKWIVAAVLLTFPLFLVFNHFGRPGTGRAAWFCAGVVFLCARFRWELSKKRWFWITISAIVLLHVPLILFVPWTSKWIPSVLIFPFVLMDAFVILVLIHQVEKCMKPGNHSKMTI